MARIQIPTDAELNALVEYDASFPFILSLDNLDEYNKRLVNWHKQPTIEISIVSAGAVKVNVLESERTVVAGDGFLIMPGFLHSVRPVDEHTPARYFTLIFHPEILYGFRDSFFDLTYYRPVARGNTPCYFFECKEWGQKLCEKLVRIKDNYKTTPDIQLQTQRQLQDAWIILAENLKLRKTQIATTHDTKKIFDLVGYLHEHYSDKFILADMAAAVSMSRNECCRYFKMMMNMTITEYLTEYRLSQAITLLESSNLSITEISERTGFCDVSYFIKTFRHKIGKTPKAYVKDKTPMRI